MLAKEFVLVLFYFVVSRNVLERLEEEKTQRLVCIWDESERGRVEWMVLRQGKEKINIQFSRSHVLLGRSVPFRRHSSIMDCIKMVRTVWKVLAYCSPAKGEQEQDGKLGPCRRNLISFHFRRPENGATRNTLKRRGKG